MKRVNKTIVRDLLSEDKRFMAATARLARWRIGQTADNPSVGTLIVRADGKQPYIVGRGVTEKGGRPHAEVVALAEAGNLAQGATVYVTLEPCSHHGKTPPCADALVSARVARVVVAARDPDSRVNGDGIARLRNADIEVVEHALTDVENDGLGPYLCRKRMQRPEITLKLAVSADGCVGLKDKGNTLISGSISQAHAHMLRAGNDAVLIGIGTAVADDPMLNCRLSGLEKRSPIRIIVDSWLRLSLDSRLVKTAEKSPVWIVCNDSVDLNNVKAFELAGCCILFCKTQAGKIDLHDLLSRLAREGISSLLVEGGAKIASSFWNANLVDQLILFQSPIVIGHGGYLAPDFSHKINKYQKIRYQKFGKDHCKKWKKVT